MNNYQFQLSIVIPKKTKGTILLSRISRYFLPLILISSAYALYFKSNTASILAIIFIALLTLIQAIKAFRTQGIIEEFERIGKMLVDNSSITIQKDSQISSYSLSDIDYVRIKLTETSEDYYPGIEKKGYKQKEGINNEIEIIDNAGNRIYNQVFIENRASMRVITKIFSSWPQGKILRIKP